MARKVTTTPETETEIRRLAAGGKTYRELSKMFGVSTKVIGRVLKAKEPHARAHEGGMHVRKNTTPPARGTAAGIIKTWAEVGSQTRTAELHDVSRWVVRRVLSDPKNKSAVESAKRSAEEQVAEIIDDALDRAEVEHVKENIAPVLQINRKDELDKSLDAIRIVEGCNLMALKALYREAIDPDTGKIADRDALALMWGKNSGKVVLDAVSARDRVVNRRSVPTMHFNTFVARVANGLAERIKDPDVKVSVLTMLNAQLAEMKMAIRQGREAEQ